MVFGGVIFIGAAVLGTDSQQKKAGTLVSAIFRLFPVIRTLGEWFKKDFAVMKARKILLLLDSSSKNGQ